jgi:hypothetical protein
MTNPFKDAVELLPGLQQKLNENYNTRPLADHLHTIITALSACRGLADGSEVIVPAPNEKTNDELRGLASLLKNNAGAAYANIDGLRSNLLEASQAILALLDERDRLLSQLPEGMKDCTIIHKQCEIGHSWLTATNWVQHGCPRCERDRLREALKPFAKEYDEWTFMPNDDAELGLTLYDKSKAFCTFRASDLRNAAVLLAKTKKGD